MDLHVKPLLLLSLICSMMMGSHTNTYRTPNNFSTVQWNARGIIDKIDDLMDTMGFKPDVLTIQESLLTREKMISTTLTENYDIVRHGEFVKTKDKKRGTTGKGIMTCIRKCHPSKTVFKQDTIFGTMIISELYIQGKRKLNIINMYT